MKLDEVGVHVGEAGAPIKPWREVLDPNDEDPDDEQLAVTPPDVVAALGFDPLDEDEAPHGVSEA